jgi:hypothetical protein
MLKKVAGVLVSVAPLSAFAAAPDFSALTAGIDFSTASAAVLAGFVLLAGFGLTIKGGKVIMRSLGLLH